MNSKFSGMLGLAMRAGKLATGEDKASSAIRGGKSFLVLLADDASANTEKKFSDMCLFHSARLIRPGDRTILGNAIGKDFSVVIAVTDKGFADRLSDLFDQE